MKKIALLAIISVLFSFTPTFAAGSYGLTTDPKTGTIKGKVLVTGYLETKNEEIMGNTYNSAYLVITNYNGDKTLEQYLKENYENGNALAPYDGQNYHFSIGCIDENKKEISSAQFKIKNPDYWAISTSSANAEIEALLEFDELPGIDGGCLSLAKNVDIAEWESFPYGQYEVKGYYVKQIDQLYEKYYSQGYLVITEYDNEALKDYLQTLIDQENYVNGLETMEGYYKLNLGCTEGEKQVGTSWFTIKEDNYKKLKSSHKNRPISALITMGALPELEGPCISHANNVEIATAPEFSGSFSDVKTLHQNSEAVEMLYKSGFIDGYPDKTFGPDLEINRAELTKIVVAMMIDNKTALNSYGNCFPDVKTEWFAPYVCYAKSQGWISGYSDGNFKPANKTNRAEAAKIVLNTLFKGKFELSTNEKKYLYLPSDIDENGWYMSFIEFAFGKNLLDLQHVLYTEYNTGDFNYEITKNITRKEVAEMIFRALNSQTPTI